MKKSTIKAMRTKGQNLDNEGKVWDADSIVKLSNMFHEGFGITEIAYKLMRGEQAVIQQLWKLGFYANIQKSRSRDNRNKCDCQCKNCDFSRTCEFSPKNRKQQTS